jgi:hypothetical protein
VASHAGLDEFQRKRLEMGLCDADLFKFAFDLQTDPYKGEPIFEGVSEVRVIECFPKISRHLQCLDIYYVVLKDGKGKIVPFFFDIIPKKRGSGDKYEYNLDDGMIENIKSLIIFPRKK